MKTNARLKTPVFFTQGLLAHMIAVLFASLYFQLVGNAAEWHEAVEQSMGFDSTTVFNLTSAVAILFLLVSFLAKLTWPMRVEEALIIILVWSLIGNLTHDSVLGMHDCHEEGEHDSPHHHHHAEQEKFEANSVKHNATSETLETTSPPPPATDAKEEGGGVMTTIGAVKSASHSFIQSSCGWSMFNIYFSVLCIISALLSFTCETQSYWLSLLFRTLSTFITMLIFLVPIACNRFRLMTVEVLILKITLYNITWNMNRFLRITQGLLFSDYRRGVEIIRKYTPILDQYSRQIIPTSQFRHGRRVPPQALPYHDESTVSDYEEGSEDEETNSSGGGGDYYSRPPRKTVYATDNPANTFSTIEKVHNQWQPLIKELGSHRRRWLTPQPNYPPHPQGPRFDHRPNGPEMPLQTRFEQHAPEQLKNFQRLYTTNRKHGTGAIFSWKNRLYNEGIVYLIDICRTVWILAICPLYLFIVFIFLFGLAYYIQNNVRELGDTGRTLGAMNSLYKNRSSEERG